MAAKKNDQGKIRYSDVPQRALQSTAKIFNFGATKYGKFNYSEGMAYSRYYDACQRHLMAWMTGEDLDPETRESHIDHAICSLMMLRDNMHLKTGTDDRNPRYKKLTRSRKTLR